MLLNLLLQTISGNLSFYEALLYTLYSIVAILIIFPVHECAHGLMALAFGDDTAKRQGRLSLNPLVHMDLYGFLLLLIFGFGWAKPVQFNPANFKNRRLGTFMTAAAGPLSNILFCMLSYVAWGIAARIATIHQISWLSLAALLFSFIAQYNAAFAVFNLIPLPPLDGSKLVGELLPFKWRFKFYGLERYSSIYFIVLVIVLNRTDVLSYVTNLLSSACYLVVELLFSLGGLFG